MLTLNLVTRHHQFVFPTPLIASHHQHSPSLSSAEHQTILKSASFCLYYNKRRQLRHFQFSLSSLLEM